MNTLTIEQMKEQRKQLHAQLCQQRIITEKSHEIYLGNKNVFNNIKRDYLILDRQIAEHYITQCKPKKKRNSHSKRVKKSVVPKRIINLIKDLPKEAQERLIKQLERM